MRTLLLPWRCSDYGGLLVTFPPVYIPVARMRPHMLHVLNIYMYMYILHVCIYMYMYIYTLCVSLIMHTLCSQNTLHTVDHGASGPIRCNRCKTYMNPFVRFVDGGRQYLCPICQCSNEGEWKGARGGGGGERGGGEVGMRPTVHVIR